jgi:PAS domain S-box-containing protein
LSTSHSLPVVPGGPADAGPFHAFFAALPIGAFIVDPGSGAIVECNELAAAQHGYDRAAFRALGIHEIVADLTAAEALTQVREIIAQAGPLHFQSRHRTRGGALRDMLVTAQPVRFDDFPRVLFTATDVTERREAERALRASEERFRSVVDNMSEGLMLFDADGNLTYQNPASLRIHGFDPAPANAGAIGHEQLPATWDAWDDAGRPITFDEWPVSRVFRHERFENQVLRVVRRETGHEFYGSYNGCPIYDADGRLSLGFITIRDISEQTHVRRALERSERRLRTFFDSEMMGALHWTVDGGLTDANDKFLRMVGYDRDDLRAGRLNWAAMTPPEHHARDARALAELAAHGVDTPYEKEFVRKDGSRVPVLIGAAMLGDEPGQGVAFVLDITERRRAESEVAAARVRAEDANRQKDHFLAMLGHELRNPLGPVRNAVALLDRTGPADPAFRRTVELIGRQVAHMTRLIDDLLDVSRIARGKITLKKHSFDVAAAVADAVDDHRPLYDAQGIALELHRPAGPMPACADAARVAQILSNLLVNAAKFTNRGGRVTVALDAPAPGTLAIRVRDTGIGMDARTLADVFEAFAQADHSIARSRGGLGLGLALVRGLAELHGGRVSAGSEGLGRGSEFVVTLPILEAPDGEGSTARPPDVAPSPARRVLIVEDNVDAAHTLRDLLALGGHDVGIAHSGADGLEAARAKPPDVVICDIGLPGDLDGYDVARALRAAPDTRTALVIALTGYGLDEDKARAHAAGFDVHLTKPVDPADVERLLAVELPRAPSRSTP